MSNFSKLNISSEINITLTHAGKAHWERVFNSLKEKTIWDKKFDEIYMHAPNHPFSHRKGHTFTQAIARRSMAGNNNDIKMELSELMFIFGSKMNSEISMFDEIIEVNNNDLLDEDDE